MTGNDIFVTVTTLLGFADTLSDVNSDTSLRERALMALNRIGADLCGMKPIDSLNCSVNINSGYGEALIYGTAMLLSLTDGDSEKNSIFTTLYNAKRTAAKSQIVSVNDALPKAVL